MHRRALFAKVLFHEVYYTRIKKKINRLGWPVDLLWLVLSVCDVDIGFAVNMQHVNHVIGKRFDQRVEFFILGVGFGVFLASAEWLVLTISEVLGSER